jgi:hypothetical protein
MGLLDGTTEKEYYSGNNHGNYQFISIKQIIDNFLFSYVGEDRIIPRANRMDVSYHAYRSFQELSYDTLKSIKSQEIDLPPSLSMLMPQDYVNYVKLTVLTDEGLERTLYPISKTSNPKAILQDDNYNYIYDVDGNIVDAVSTTSTNFSADPHDVSDGNRLKVESQFNSNGDFYIDTVNGTIGFSSNLSGKTVTLKYISDGLGTDAETLVHKFAEEAMYKSIACEMVSTRANTPEYVVNRFKRDKYSAVRKAKLRLSNLKMEEVTQLMRGKSKQLKS